MLDKFDALLPGGGSGLVGPRAGWATTTHDWSLDVDENHLWDVLERWATFGAGGAAHLVLEVLAYADDEATALGRTGHCTVTEHADGSFTTSDDGRGTDTRRDRWGAVVRRPVMSTRDVRFSGDDGGLVFSVALEDITAAADLFRPVWDRTDGVDGYVSIEVPPGLAYDTDQPAHHRQPGPGQLTAAGGPVRTQRGPATAR